MNEDKCQQCGTPASPGAKFCESCGARLERPSAPSRPPAPAQAPQTAPPYAPGYETPPYYAPGAVSPYQGVAIRFVATLVDYIIIGIIAIVLSSPFFGTALITNPTTNAVIIGPGYVVGMLVALTVFFLYFTFLEGRNGQTVGKMAVKIKVVREADGSLIDYEDAAVRTVFRLIDGILAYLIGAILIWSSDKKQRLGDQVAHTVIVRA